MLRSLSTYACCWFYYVAAAESVVQLFVKNNANRTILVSVKLSTTLHELKDAIRDREGIPQDQQRLMLGLKELHAGFSDHTIAELGMQDGSSLTLSVRPLGRIGMLWSGGSVFCARMRSIARSFMFLPCLLLHSQSRLSSPPVHVLLLRNGCDPLIDLRWARVIYLCRAVSEEICTTLNQMRSRAECREQVRVKTGTNHGQNELQTGIRD